MKTQIRGYLMLIICFLFIWVVTADVFAQGKPPTHPSITNQIDSNSGSPVSDKPPTTPPQELKKEFTGSPVTDRPPTHPTQSNNLQDNQVLNNGADDYPPPPPPVEERKPVLGGPVNDKRPDPPTTTPDKKPKGIKKVFTNISSPKSRVKGIKDEGEQIDTTKSASQSAAIPTGTISASPEESVGVKKEAEKISSPKPELGKGKLKPDDKPVPARSLKKKQKTNIPTRSITKPPAVIEDKEQKGK